MAENKDNPEKYLRENLKDLQEYSKKLLSQKGKPTPNKEALLNRDASDWNIRNWGNFWDDNPSFDNH